MTNENRAEEISKLIKSWDRECVSELRDLLEELVVICRSGDLDEENFVDMSAIPSNKIPKDIDTTNHPVLALDNDDNLLGLNDFHYDNIRIYGWNETIHLDDFDEIIHLDDFRAKIARENRPDELAKLIKTWDCIDIDQLREWITELMAVCREFDLDTDDYVDTTSLPSAEIPDDVDTTYPIWAMDNDGDMLVGDCDEILSLAEYHAQQS